MGIILENEAEYFGMKNRIRELKAENLRLKAENAAWIREHQNLVHLYQNQLAENAELREQVEELTAQLAFKEVADHPNDLLDVGAICDHRDRLIDQLAAIDAAMGRRVMKIGWLYKRDSEDTEWCFSETKPERWYYCITQIVYSEIQS